MKTKSKKSANVPNLRFPGFKGEWESLRFAEVGLFLKGKGISKEQLSLEGRLCILYGELYTKYKDEVITEVYSRTNIDTDGLIESIYNDIIIPSSGETTIDISTACCVNLDGVLLGGDLNIIRPYQANGSFISYQINGKRKKDIAKIAQGTSVVHLYNDSLKGLIINLPQDREEQDRIVKLLSQVDTRIQTQRKIIEELTVFKNGLSKNLFSQELRFKDDKGKKFLDWKKKKLGEVCDEHLLKNKNNVTNEVFSVAKHKGVINQIEHLGRSFSAKEILHYKLIYPGDLVYTKSPTSDFPFGIIKQNRTGRIGVVSPLYCVFKPKTFALGYLLHEYFTSAINTYNYLSPLVQKGAKNTMNINNYDFLNGASFLLPVDETEQIKTTNFFSSIDAKITTEKEVLEKYEKQKKYLLQNLFM